MSASAIGSQSNQPNPLLLSLLSRLQAGQFTPGDSAPVTAGSSTQGSTASAPIGCTGGNCTAKLSADIMKVLMAMQAQTSSIAQSGTTSTISASNPAQQLFAAMDTDGDGTVNEAEMESYIEKQGGTQEEADKLFSSLNQQGVAGMSENQIAALAQQSGGAHGHHHHHHGGGGIADKAAQDLLNALDSNGDGTASQSEFTNYLTQIGGTSSEASQDYAALTQGGTKPLTATSLADALKTIDASKVNLSDQTSPILSVLDAIGNGDTLSKPKTSAV